ncbi:DUF1513 domain-containing protein [Vibrio methylphosphonaticus]|uniref:DUF1513 domain-containing protein n=1 Tax=Vibrio methylphosphonaticus TaxID=2946866 RepID=UPI002029ED16|nr:DUF1513 domain-containing protein [Vibrio methylphosphonaticus]MCL9775853.1 DUF1513 domain-containing protein [Vibrio methylphosphonaticus]
MQLMAIDITKRNLMRVGAMGVIAPTWLVGCSTASPLGVKKGPAPRLIGGSIRQNGEFDVVIAANGSDPVHQLPLPGRGHGVAIHPHQPLAVMFGRRPGTYAMIFNVQTGRMESLLLASKQRHYYGHGVFSSDGRWLYATEGERSSSRGIIGVYDTQQGYKKVEEFTGFGLGPHEIIVMENGTLVVGVGGVHTDGRTPLNLTTMKPSLAYLSASGELLEQVTLADHRKSIRHLAHDGDEVVLTGQQYRGEADSYVPLVALHKRGQPMQELGGDPEDWARFNHYVASIAATKQHIVATSPRGNCYGIWDKETRNLLQINVLPDASGVVVKDDQFFISSGAGKVVKISSDLTVKMMPSPIQWDNHWQMIT